MANQNLSVYYFNSIERYKTFFVEYHITNANLLELKNREGEHAQLWGPQGVCTIVYNSVAENPYIPEEESHDVFSIHTTGNIVAGRFYIRGAGLTDDDADVIPFDKMLYMIMTIDVVSEPKGGKMTHRRKNRINLKRTKRHSHSRKKIRVL